MMNADAPEWLKSLWRESWKDAYIPKNLRKKIKITIDKKSGLPIVIKIKNRKQK